MTVSAFGPSRPWLLRAAITLGHYVDPHAYLIPVLIGLSLVSRLWVGEVGEAVSTPHTIAILALIVAYTTQAIHASNLCDRDSLPFLDPAAAVQQRIGWLRLYHRKRLTMALAAVMIPLAMTPMNVTWPLWSRILMTVVLLAVSAANAFTSHATRVHNQLHLWCPWCPRFRGEGDDDTTPAPQPQPTGTVND